MPIPSEALDRERVETNPDECKDVGCKRSRNGELSKGRRYSPITSEMVETV
jgi:hypothetical protein